MNKTGGIGGGYIKLEGSEIVMNGMLDVCGEDGRYNGRSYCGGGGSGGSILLISPNVLIGSFENCNLNAMGGKGYESKGRGKGGDGSIGFIKILSSSMKDFNQFAKFCKPKPIIL